MRKYLKTCASQKKGCTKVYKKMGVPPSLPVWGDVIYGWSLTIPMKKWGSERTIQLFLKWWG